MELQELVERIERWKQRVSNSESKQSLSTGGAGTESKAHDWDSDGKVGESQMKTAGSAGKQADSVALVDESDVVNDQKISGDKEEAQAESLDVDDLS